MEGNEGYVEQVAKALEMLAERVRSGDCTALQFTGICKSFGLAEMTYTQDGSLIQAMLLAGPVGVNALKLQIGILQLQERDAQKAAEAAKAEAATDE